MSMDGNDDTHRVSLEFRAGPVAMQGTVEHRDGTLERFWGWLELMATLDRVADRGSGTDPVREVNPIRLGT